MSPSPSEDEEAVRALYFGLLECWNRRDAGAYAALFAEDGNVVGFDGSPLDGRDGIAAELGPTARPRAWTRSRRPKAGSR